MEPFHCECGTTLRLHEKHVTACLAHHYSSKNHKYRRKVEKMLSKTGLRHSEIARQLGITPGDVAIIAKELGFPHGRSRRTASAADERHARWWNTVGKHPAVRKCLSLGFVVEPIQSRGRTNKKYRRSIFLVNGHRVVSLFMAAARKAPGGVVWKLQAKQNPEADFQVGKADKVFYIFPRAVLQELKTTSFVDNLTFPGDHLTRTRQHDYRDCRDAWYLLAAPKRGWRRPADRGAA